MAAAARSPSGSPIPGRRNTSIRHPVRTCAAVFSASIVSSIGPG